MFGGDLELSSLKRYGYYFFYYQYSGKVPRPMHKAPGFLDFIQNPIVLF